jgi:EAL domain-containing protein (putative c-di-GMP-specific phosphodiesterase class I)
MTFNSTIGASARGMVFVSIHPRLITSSLDTQAEVLAGLLRTCGLPPEQVVVEISSDAIGDDTTKWNWFEALFRNYRRYGLRVALVGLPVDHGTPYLVLVAYYRLRPLAPPVGAEAKAGRQRDES